jgi:methionyl-tRNA synthetase
VNDIEDRESNKVLVLCALPYTNAIPHIGNIVGSHLPSDIFSRFCRLRGDETILIGGTDESGTTTEIAASDMGVSPQELTDVLYKIHKEIYDWFNISYDNFSRTSLPIHHQTTQDFFLKIYNNGFISEGILKLPYCEKDMMYLPDRYVEGICPHCGYEGARGDQCEKCTSLLDPDQLEKPKCKICKGTPVFRDVKHLFLDLDKIQPKIVEWLQNNKVLKEQLVASAIGSIGEGLKKRCITRDLRWGVKVPLKGYEDKVFYVWFDATIGYISSTKEWAIKRQTPDEWKKYWKEPSRIYNFIGKDNIPFHTIFWPGMLIANGEYNLPYQVIGLNFCNYEGNKISKSKGWGIFCENIVKSGVSSDTWRFYLTFLIPETKDSEFKWQEFEDRINLELIGNFGNFVNRTLSFIWNKLDGNIGDSDYSGEREKRMIAFVKEECTKVTSLLEQVRLREALLEILKISDEGNKYLQEKKPWELLKTDRKECEKVLNLCANVCKTLAIVIEPYLPSTSKEILRQLNVDYNIKWEDADKVDLKAHKLNQPGILFEKITKEKLEELKKEVTKVTPLKELWKKYQS